MLLKCKALIRRAAALTISLLLVLGQTAIPLSALATDTATLPTLRLYYNLTAEDPAPQSLDVTASLYAGQPVYWATLPEQAFSLPVSLEVIPAVQDETITYAPSAVTAQNASAVDGVSLSATVSVMQNGTPVAIYPLYLSTVALPPETPVNGWVTVTYFDVTNNTTLDSQSVELTPGSHTLTPDRASEFAGYELVDPNQSYTVNVANDGTVDIPEVIFNLQAVQQPEEPKNGFVTVIYFDITNNNALDSQSVELTPGSHTLTPDRASEFAGYELADPNQSYAVNVANDGTVDIPEVVFNLQAVQQPEEPKNGFVTVTYFDVTNNTTLDSQAVELTPGSHTLTPNRASEFAGYELVDPNQSYAIDVANDGSVNLTEVVFNLQAVQQEEPSTPGETPINRYGLTNTGGLNFRAKPSKGSTSYAMVNSGTRAWVYSLVVNDAGEEWYKINYNKMDCYVLAEFLDLTVEIPVNYVDATTGETFYNETAFCRFQPSKASMQTVVSVDLSKAADRTLQSADSVTVTVDANGNADVSSIEFTFVSASQGVSVSVSLRFVDTNGNAVPGLQADALSLTPGAYPTDVYALAAPQGYAYQGASVSEIVVGEDGTCNVTEVVYTYELVPVQAKVTYRYLDDLGQAIAALPEQVLTLSPGVYESASQRPEADPAGYVYAGVDIAQVEVTADGQVLPSEVVTFTYNRQAVSGEITLRYVDANGNRLRDDRTETLGQGPYSSASFAMEIENYTFVEARPETFVIDEQGAASPEIVELVYEAKPAQPVNLTVYHVYAAGGNVTDPVTVPLQPGTYPYTDFALTSIPAGYELNSTSAQEVVVSEAGGIQPESLTLTYAPIPGLTAHLIVQHLDASRNPVAPQADYDLEPGTYSYTLFAIDDPDGYNFASVDYQEVVVSADGTISTPLLVFLYVPKPTLEASVTVQHLSTSGMMLGNSMSVKLAAGEAYNMREYALALDGYTVKSVSPEVVNVDDQGNADAELVTITYEEIQNTATVEVHYRNLIGADLPGSPQILSLENGRTHTVTPDAAYVPEGYLLSANSAQSYEVRVKNLVATPNSVTFTYYESSVRGSVTVNYYNMEDLSLITSEVRQLVPGTHTLTPDESLVAAKGNYTYSGAPSGNSVIVLEDGTTSPATISFYYKPASVSTYVGYALVTTATPIRSAANTDASSVIQQLPVNTLLWVTGEGQSGSIQWYYSSIVLGSSVSGWVDSSHVRQIDEQTAQALIEEYNDANPPQIEQDTGYYITIVNNVPLRTQASPVASVVNNHWLGLDTVVYVSSQSAGTDNRIWHRASYNNQWGYIRSDQLRKLTEQEVTEYIQNGGQSPSETDPGSQTNPNGASSYGYVTTDNVNFRSSPSATSSTVIRKINRYGMALVLGTRVVDGVTWYNVNYSGTVGWIHGSYFHQMTMTEFTSFLGSTEYYAGIRNNTTSSSSGSSGSTTTGGSTGSATQGNVNSVEDWNVGVWQNTGVNTNPSYAPFDPYSTPTASATPSPNATGSLGPSGSLAPGATLGGTTEPDATFVIGTMIPITYEDESRETQTGSVPWLFIGGAVVLIGGAGGVYAYALNQNRKRKAAAAKAAASRRTAAGATAAGAASPYARRAVAAPPAAGTQQRTDAKQTPPNGQAHSFAKPGAATSPFSAPPVSGSRIPNPYAKPADSATTNPYVKPAGSAATNPFAKPVEGPKADETASESNPFAKPVGSAATNPFAKPVEGPKADETAPSANPFARPVNPASASNAADAQRRRSRTQRYQDAEDGDDRA